MKKIQAIDLFCGVGGLTYGLRQAGIDVKAGLDSDSSCKYAFEVNNQAKFISADISNYNFNQLSSLYSNDSIRVLVGCTPCQPFSSHTYKVKKTKVDTRWNLIDYFAEAIRKIMPHIVSMENVRGIRKTDVFQNFISSLTCLGYQIDYKVLYCPDYGIPQGRKRLVLLGSRLGKIEIPKQTHTKEKYLTLSDTIKHLPAIKGGEVCIYDHLHRAKTLLPTNLQRIQQSKPGGSWRDWDERLLPDCYKKESGQTYTSVYGRASWCNVSPTITTQFYNYGSGRFGHPQQDRAFSVREGALLQTFPQDYDFGELTSLAKTGRHIGNAVPPRLGFVIGNSILKHINNTHDN